MNKFLRNMRIVIATIVFVVITCGFLNMSGGNILSQLALRTQFVPALVSLFTGSALAFAVLFVITLLFGRVYCSFLCPLGIFQDIVTRISNIVRKRNNGGKLPKQSYRKPHNVLRYTILAITAIALVVGFTYPLALLDPYSNYGKIAGQIFSSAELAITNMLSGVFPSVFYVQQYVKVSMYAFIYSAFFLILVTVFSAARGRLYCNTICPVGTFLGLIGGISLFKPAIDKDKCVKCNLCAGKCKSNCINLETKEIDATRCVACYDCLTACKRGGVKLVPTWFGNQRKNEFKRDIESKERRNAIIAMGGFATAVAARSIIRKNRFVSPEGSVTEGAPILPPGAGNVEAFKDACTACHACIAACPQKIIKPASFEYGWDGIMLPTLKYNKNYCLYECNACSQTCPHGAIRHITLEEKQKTQIAVASYNPSSCVIVSEGVKCGACSRNCPTGAIKLTESALSLQYSVPEIDTNLCIGCGSCENVCPALPKAITVSGKSIQTTIG